MGRWGSQVLMRNIGSPKELPIDSSSNTWQHGKSLVEVKSMLSAVRLVDSIILEVAANDSHVLEQ
jgi:predicted proteasome-type protease